jgi:hypothetical protein
MLDIAHESLMATVYWTTLIVALEEFFGRVQIFTLAKYYQQGRSSKGGRPDFRGSTRAVRDPFRDLPNRHPCSMIVLCQW